MLGNTTHLLGNFILLTLKEQFEDGPLSFNVAVQELDMCVFL